MRFLRREEKSVLLLNFFARCDVSRSQLRICSIKRSFTKMGSKKDKYINWAHSERRAVFAKKNGSKITFFAKSREGFTNQEQNHDTES